MYKYISFLILLIGLNFSLFSQGTQLELDTFVRSVPDVGFNGNTIRGPSWVDSTFNDSVLSMYPKILRYPAGGVADYWDWNTGWFYPQSVLDTAIIDTIYTMNSGWYTLDTVACPPIVFQQALNQIGAEGIFNLNMMSANVSIQSAALRAAITQGVLINKVELGSEMNHGNIFKIMKYPTAGDYARECNLYIDSIKAIIPDAEIAVVGGNRGADSTRSWRWNDSIYSIVDSVDALVWHIYLYLNDEDTAFSTKQLLAFPFYQVPLYEKWRGFNDTITSLQDYEVWITEYNLFDKTFDKRYTNTWAQVLMLSAMNNEFLKNRLVEMILLHNIGGIFTNFDALDTEHGFRKRATGIFAAIWNKPISNMTSAINIQTSSLLIDSVEYTNNNGLINTVYFPKLFGWKFQNNTHEAVIVTNLSSDTVIVSVSDLFTSTDISWEKWSSDSLLAHIDSIAYLQHTLDTGLVDIILPPYSLNIAIGFLCDQLVYNSEVSICEGDSFFVSTSAYFEEGIYTDSLSNIYGCDSLIITDLDFYVQNMATISISSFILETEQLMSNYQWYFEGDSILGANQFNLLPIQPGNYAVSYFDDNDCFSISNMFLYELLEINNECKSGKQLLKITDLLGREVNSKEVIDNIALIYIYNDGSVEKYIIIE
jgi:hypothetical protein